MKTKEQAKKFLAMQYNVKPDHLMFVNVWKAPEVNKTFLMFQVTDPNHHQFGSTLCQEV